jgi:starch synthase (maltosyl-transferring)
VVVVNVQPEVADGKYAAKAIVGETLTVEADVFADGHDVVRAVLLHRHESEREWRETELELINNDHWAASFKLERLGLYCYTVTGWVDGFRTWRRTVTRRLEAGQDTSADLTAGEALFRAAAARAEGGDRERIAAAGGRLADEGRPATARAQEAVIEELAALIDRYPDRAHATSYSKELSVRADPALARFSAWYEMFPRSASPDPGRHGTFRDVEARLPYIEDMGFDILYLPPIHPVGSTNRKGKNNAVRAEAGDYGSPWAIGSAEGGHKAVNPLLGTPEDFRRLVEKARERRIEVALDIAFQCSPDHPYLKEHPDWFRWRPDGTIQYAENPPKKYEDIVPFDFECEDRDALIEELIDVVRHWVRQGVRVFRVDNPHTKPFALWERLIETLKSEQPDLIFLSEAFTRPKIMYRLAQIGFTQSYTYFAWRNNKWELAEYLNTVTRPPVSTFFRPNLWPNTPDILTEYLQTGGRPAFMARLVLAATLGASYGIYGPPFEMSESRPREHGSEEYLDSEKYQLRHWDLDRPDSLRHFISRVNAIRRENTALQHNSALEFHNTDNPELICYSKRSPDGENSVVAVVNLNPRQTQAGFVDLDMDSFGANGARPYQVHDLLTGARYFWQGRRHFVQLDPHRSPAHIFAVRKYVRTEKDFDYYQ